MRVKNGMPYLIPASEETRGDAAVFVRFWK